MQEPTKNLEKYSLPESSANINNFSQNEDIKKNWKFYLISYLISAGALNFVWWFYPTLDYKTSIISSSWDTISMVIFSTILIASSIFIIFNSFIEAYWSIAPIIFSMLVAFNFQKSYNFQIAVLLLLLGILLIIIQVKIINFKGIFALISFSVLAATALPTAVFFLQHNHVSTTFIQSTIPLIIAFNFFFTPIFLSNINLSKITSLIFGIILILFHMFLGFNITTFLAIILIIFTWLIVMNMNLKYKYVLPIYTILLMIDTALLYLQQKI
ncbi:MAG: hypothetical protein LBC17_00255 [Lactobacillaceae bacterium]|jgi:hypothetical protein|nr:hypothetical protein [Lactobacillaceae bacterium]